MTSEMLQSSDGTALHTVHFPAQGEAKAHVLVCHGANEHIGRSRRPCSVLIARLYRAYYGITP